jgi:hypothetical protein
VPCAKRLYSGSVLPAIRREILQFTFMLGQYQRLCLVEEFQKLKDDTLCITSGIKKKTVLIG